MSEGEETKGKSFFSRHIHFRDSRVAADRQQLSMRSLVKRGDRDLSEIERNEQVLLARILTTAESVNCDSPRVEDTKQELTPQTCSLDRSREKEFDFSRFRVVHDKSSMQASKISNFEVSRFTFRSTTQPKRRFLKKAEASNPIQAFAPVLFGLLLDGIGTAALGVTTLLGLAALAALWVLRPVAHP